MYGGVHCMWDCGGVDNLQLFSTWSLEFKLGSSGLTGPSMSYFEKWNMWLNKDLSHKNKH